jgi:murein DD-endopeptidase MepM/ murein hydrolase activator NlpD
LKQVRQAAAQIADNVKDLSELIAKLSQQAAQTPAMSDGEKGVEKELVGTLPPDDKRAAAPGSIPAAIASDEPGIPSGAAPGKTEEVAMLTPPMARDTPSSVIELAPAASVVSPGNTDLIRPAVAFATAKGKLPLPAQGRRVLGFGDKTQHGGTSKGLVLETRFDARVTSPCDGWVVYAGEFRSYGQLLIINAGGGYYVLVAGMSQMDVGPGQFVLASEPIGTMSGAPRTAQLAAEKTGLDETVPQSSAPVLYIEFRKDGQPVDSDPWWVAPHQKVQE